MEVPLVVFVNSKSGGLQGTKITSKFKKCISPENVFDLSQGGPLPGLQKYTGQKYRIIVCGGDGSVGWVLTEIDKLKLSKDLIPPVAILPIGTGNDLSRVLKWGGTHPGTKLKSFMHKVEKACVVLLDKWQLTYTGEGEMPHTKHFMNNYFSVGADAHIALQFHEMRLAHPEKFSSRTQNLTWYVRLGLQNRSPEVISSHVQVEINGKKAELPEQTRCVVVLNLPSYSGGANPWGSKKSTRNHYSNPAIDDGLLEVVAMNGPLQLVGIHASIIRGKRLGQGNHIKITTTKAFSAQVDGEPWTQPASVTSIQFVGKSRMLANSMPSTAPQTTAPKLTSTPSSASLVAEKEQVVARSFSSHTLMRTRSASNPIQHTPSPIKYGPVQPSKRRKNRMYCESCGLEFYLPYMLANHQNSGLCTSGSSSVKAPSTPTLSVQVGDGASTHEPTSRDVSDDEGGMWRSQSEDFGSRKISVSDYDDGKQDKISVPTSPREIKSEPQSQPQSQSPQIESQSEPQKQAEPREESQTETKHPESQFEFKSESQSESKPEPDTPESQSESPSEPQPLSESRPESDSQQEPETTQENNKAGVESSVEPVPLPEQNTPTTPTTTIESNTCSSTPTSEPSNTPQDSTSEESKPVEHKEEDSSLVDEGVSGQ